MVKKLNKPKPVTLLIEGFHIYLPINKGNGIAHMMADNIVAEIENLYQNRYNLRVEYIEEQRRIWDTKKDIPDRLLPPQTKKTL